MQDEINISNIENKIQVQRKKIKENKEECAKSKYIFLYLYCIEYYKL